MTLPANEIVQGNVIDRLRALPEQSVNCIITSPPYYGLRSYGTEPTVWAGCDETCQHEWGEESYQRRTNDNKGEASKQSTNVGSIGRDVPVEHARCTLCAAWRGHLGLEPDPRMYVRHLVMVFREARRALRDDGVLWLNLGDSFASTGGHTKQGATSQRLGRRNVSAENAVKGSIPEGFKPKDLMGIPWRTAIALQDDGWYLRSDVIWSKPNAMPESVTDRPTRAHEYFFMLTKQASYWSDFDAIKEPATKYGDDGSPFRHKRSVWTLSVGNTTWEFCGACRRFFDGDTIKQIVVGENADRRKIMHCVCGRTDAWISHFATFPEELVEPPILATVPERVCGKCAAPIKKGNDVTMDWVWTCDCAHAEPAAGIVCDPFMGSGTVALVAVKARRRFVGIELNPDFVEIARHRLAPELAQNRLF